MGYNTTVLILNDYLGDIEKDEHLGDLLALAIRSRQSGEAQTPVGNGVYVVETHHADEVVIVAVGGNMGRILATMPGHQSSDTDIVRTLINKTGYRASPVLVAPSSGPALTDQSVREWAEKNGLVIMSRSDYEHFGKKPKKMTRMEMNEYVKKEYGYRLIELRKKEKPTKVIRKKISG